jgi:hypothetical protein
VHEIGQLRLCTAERLKVNSQASRHCMIGSIVVHLVRCSFCRWKSDDSVSSVYLTKELEKKVIDVNWIKSSLWECSSF